MNAPEGVGGGQREGEPGVDEAISPELALVDPELAQRARLTLPEPSFLSRSVAAPSTSLRTRLNLTPAPAAAARSSPPAAVALPEPARPRVEPRRRPVWRALAGLALYVVMPILLVSAITYAAEFASDPAPTLLPPPPTTTAGAETGLESAPQETDAPRADVQPAPAAPTPTPATLPQPVAPDTKPELDLEPESEQPRQPARPAQPESQPAPPRTRTPPAPRKSVTPSSPTAEPTVLVWLPVRDAAAYRLELFRDKKRIFAAVTKQPRMELPLSWLYESVRYRLERGTHRWVVRPLRNRGSRLVPGDPVVDSVWVVRAPAG